MQSKQMAVDQFRAAVVGRQWAKAEELLPAFRAAVETAWANVRNDEERRSLQDEVLMTLRWARAMALVGRGQARDNLIQISRHSRYRETQGPSTTVQVDG